MLQHELDAFVWSKMGTEAGEPLEDIMHRKEIERQANDGKFVWGIGNSPGDSIVSFMQNAGPHMAVFTPMISPPKDQDVNCPDKVVWRAYKNRQGGIEPLPPYSFVISRAKAARPHCALLCECDEDLRTQCHGKLHTGEFVHYVTCNPKLPPNSTNMMKKGEGRSCKPYPIRFVASLYGEGWVKLTDYADISPETIKKVKRSADDGDIEKWKALINKIKGE